MKRIVVAWTAVFFFCGLTFGQELPPSHYEHLKCYDQLIGQWLYEGQILEDVPGVVKKGEEVSIRITNRWILDKNAVESNLTGEVKGGMKITAKSLAFWDAANPRILEGGLNSLGHHTMSTVSYDEATKTWTIELKGVDGKGEPLSQTGVLTLQDKDTYVFQALNREGGLVQGDSPKYTYKRVERAKRARPRGRDN